MDTPHEAGRPEAVESLMTGPASAPALAQPSRLMGWLEQFRPQIEAVARGQFTPDRLFRLVAGLLRDTPGLADCSPISLAGCMMQAAQLGLEPGVLGQCWFLPFRDGRTKTLEARFIVGYRGYLTLLYRNPRVVQVRARAVAERDQFRLQYGTHEHLEHIPYTEGDPGRDIGYYLLVDLRGADHPYIGYMSRAEVDKHRQASPSNADGPWATHYREMALKTLIRVHWRWLPTDFAVDLVDEAVPTPDAVTADA